MGQKILGPVGQARLGHGRGKQVLHTHTRTHTQVHRYTRTCITTTPSDRPCAQARRRRQSPFCPTPRARATAPTPKQPASPAPCTPRAGVCTGLPWRRAEALRCSAACAGVPAAVRTAPYPRHGPRRAHQRRQPRPIFHVVCCTDWPCTFWDVYDFSAGERAHGAHGVHGVAAYGSSAAPEAAGVPIGQKECARYM